MMNKNNVPEVNANNEDQNKMEPEVVKTGFKEKVKTGFAKVKQSKVAKAAAGAALVAAGVVGTLFVMKSNNGDGDVVIDLDDIADTSGSVEE